jgi:hypothetical protein
VLDHLASGVKLVNAAGLTKNARPLGSPFVVASLGSSGEINKGQSVKMRLVFSATSAKAIHFPPRILVGLSVP